MRVSLAVTLAMLGGCQSAPRPPAQSPEQRAAASDAWNVAARQFLADEGTALRRCYEAELKRVEDAAVAGEYRNGNAVPSLAGALVLTIPVEADGRVEAPRVEQDTLRNPEVASCLRARADAWQFAPPPDGEALELEVPFEFSLAGPDVP
jgi:hypothetical protein